MNQNRPRFRFLDPTITKEDTVLVAFVLIAVGILFAGILLTWSM